MPARPEHADPLVAAFLTRAADAPGDPIVVSPSRSIAFGDVHRLALALVPALVAQAPGSGALVALAVPDGPAFLAALLAIRMSGHAALLLDAHAPAVERTARAEALGAVVGVTASSGWPTAVDAFSVTRVDGAPQVLDDAAIVKLTSGSTGTPRGVAVSTAAMLADEAQLYDTMGLRPDDRLLATVPWSHSYGFTTLVLSAIVRGLPLILPEDRTRLAAPLDAAAVCGATVFPTAPAYLAPWIGLSAPPPLPPSVRLVISAGATLAPSIAERFRRFSGRAAHTFYGSSECGGICYDQQGDAAERGTVGTPVRGVTIELAPVLGRHASEGLIVVRSPAVAATYLPAADARLSHGRFETADIGRFADGEIAIVGRASQVINVRGRKVDPAEVEQVIRRLDAVDDVVVVGLPQADGGEVVRAVVAGPTPPVSDASVRAWCAAHLAPHKVPRSIVLVPAIRYTARGKVDTAWLAGLGAH
ncbi:MAG: class I adenylate-forming enzyme family protein [Vicinamibacterales bacterium]